MKSPSKPCNWVVQALHVFTVQVFPRNFKFFRLLTFYLLSLFLFLSLEPCFCHASLSLLLGATGQGHGQHTDSDDKDDMDRDGFSLLSVFANVFPTTLSSLTAKKITTQIERFSELSFQVPVLSHSYLTTFPTQ